MELNQWAALLRQQCTAMGFPKDKLGLDFLLSKSCDALSNEQEEIIIYTRDIIWRIVLGKAAIGRTVGNPDRIKQRYGMSVEENYGLSQGPFIDLARSYWTFKLELRDLFPNHREIMLAAILSDTEVEIASVFFPSPGPSKIPVEVRKAKQVELLKKYAPGIDIQRFVRENPILKLRLTRMEDPEEIKKYSYIKPAPFSVPHCYAPCLGTKMTCSLEPGHEGPHVAHGFFKKVYAVWED